MSEKFNRSAIFNCLRLILFCFIVFHYFFYSSNLGHYFRSEILPQAKDGTLFVSPASSTGESYSADFLTLYAAGVLNQDRIEKKLEINVYNPFLLRQSMERVVAPLKLCDRYVFHYTPIIFALITPLAYFDLYTAWCIYFFFSVICLTIAYLCLAGDNLKENPSLLFGLPLALTAFPVVENFFSGQLMPVELAIIALSFRFLIDKKYFWAGIIAALSFIKWQTALVVLIPGLLTGRKNFSYGFFLMLVIELILSLVVVDFSNLVNFVKANWLLLNNSFSESNSALYHVGLIGMLQCLPWSIADVYKVSKLAYFIVLLFTFILWLKFLPSLQKRSDKAIQLLASFTVIAFTIFGLHNYSYDYALYLIPCLWLFIWSTENSAAFNLRQTILRFGVSIIVFYIPFFFWENLMIRLNSENNPALYQVRAFFAGIILLLCASTAIFIEFNKKQMVKNSIQ